MTRKSKIVYIVGSIAIGVAAVLIIFLALIASGVIDVRQKSLVISSASADFTYDGERHVCGDWSLVEGNLKDGHELKVNVTGSQTEIGSSENYLSATVIDKNGADVTSDYKIEYRTGTLTVRGKHLTIITNSAKKVYDGTPLYPPEDGWALSAATPLDDGHEISFIEMNSSQTNAGSCANAVSQIRITDGDKDVTDRYEVTYVTGTLTVLPLQVTVETPSAQKIYDGEPLKNAEYEIISSSGLMEGHTAAAVITASLTDVGVKENFVAEFKVSDSDGNDVSQNYEVTYILGNLLVTPRTIAVRSASASKSYDGKPLTDGGFEIISLTKPLQGHTLDAAVTGSRTMPGVSENTISEVAVKDSGGKDVSFNYEFNLELGTLTVYGEAHGSGGSVNLNPDGDIGGGPLQGEGGDDTPRAALSIKSSQNGNLYLRFKSFGDYNGKKWSEADSYGKTFGGGFSYNYLTSCYLGNANLPVAKLAVMLNGNNYLLPYYTGTGNYGYTAQTDDVTYQGADYEYSLEYIPFNYLRNSLPECDLGALSAEESEYRVFVYSQYLSVPASVQTCLDDIISNQKFSASDSGVIAKVASYIRGAAKYNLEYERGLDKSDDIIVAFLTEYKEGICSHYASAATLLYRRLGIPARYTVGYSATVQAETWTDVTAADAHAWVEVYLNGVGWVQVEVTGSSGNTGDSGDIGGAGGSGGTGEGTGSVITEFYEIKPVTEYYMYDGVTTYTHSGRVQGIQKLLDRGYRYEAVVDGKRRDLGFAECRITSFKLFNAQGVDVTGQFGGGFEFAVGKLQVYIKELDVTTQSLTGVYDGTPLTAAECGVTGNLLSGHKISMLNAVGSRIAVGAGVNDYEILITDASGADVTYMYKLNPQYGTLTVLPREITVTGRSKTFDYTAEIVSCAEYDITAGELAPGHTAEVEINSTLKGVGRRDNVISGVKIYDADGNDVTANYSVTTANGTLTILPPQ